MKILVEVNLDQPPLRRTKLKCEGQEVWVDFRYEGLAMFYFYCGKVGHSERDCICRQRDIIERSFKEGQYGD